MKELYPLSGVVAIPQTPFDDDDRIDLDSFDRGVDDRLAAGVDGLLYPVVASEVSRLTDGRAPDADARRPRAGRRAGAGLHRGERGRRPRPCGPSPSSPSKHGAAGVLVQAPVALLRDEARDARLLPHGVRGADRVLMIQDLEWGGPGLPVATIVRLFEELEPFRCIKVETVPAGPKYTAILAATGGRLNVAAGWAVPYLIEALDRGIHAVTPGGLHWVIAEVIRRYRGGRPSTARGPCSTVSCRSSAGRTSTSTSRTSS